MNDPKTILILAANPKDTTRLRLDEEVREIEEGLHRAKNRSQFIIQARLAVRLRDLRRAMLDYEPQIVHFCGHGSENGLMVEDKYGNALFVNPLALSGLFELFSSHIECVLLNACYSESQAIAINEHINYVIGMPKTVKDDTSIEFAVGFYDALGAGKSIEDSFKFGLNAVQFHELREEYIPVLKQQQLENNNNNNNNNNNSNNNNNEKQNKHKLITKYVCSNNPQHIFDEMTYDGFCPEPECAGIGFLFEPDDNATSSNRSIVSAKYVCSNDSRHVFSEMTIDGFCPKPECYGIGFLSEIEEVVPKIREVGVCILLIDASVSMDSLAFSSGVATKAQFIAGSISGGLFDLIKDSTRGKDFYIVGGIFNSETYYTFVHSAEEILEVYSDASTFAKFLTSHFTYGDADISSALDFAKQIYDNVMGDKGLSEYGGPKNVKPIMHTIPNQRGEQTVIPNIRVLLCTSGYNKISGDVEKNPFASNDGDILMVAFLGESDDTGCAAIKNFVSKCPIHGVEQFFLINEPIRFQTLRRLFRMASGASGFCPVCLAQDIF